MNIVRWQELDEAQRQALLARPPQLASATLQEQVRAIIARVRSGGDAALRALSLEFDGVAPVALEVQVADTDPAAVPAALQAAMSSAKARLARFHEACRVHPVAVETAPGMRCERLVRAIGRVGLYIPAGTAPLPSTALMLGVPAQLAGCREVVACTPPGPDGMADPAVLHAARLCGISRVFVVGGAQAIAAMAYGTDTVPRCDKLFGPGNAWVTAAKREVAADPEGPAIDLPAGPSELLAIADAGARPAFLAADLLAQAEHGPDAQVLLLSDDAALLDAVHAELAVQLRALPRQAIAREALRHGRLVQVADMVQALEIANAYAPEHLLLALREPRRWLPGVQAAGSVFLGDLTPEALGDYCSGTNHVLPTHGAARAASGVSVASFQTFITVQQADPAALRSVGPDAVALARAERLEGHAHSVALRLAALEGA
jgi:histidinol dehydrogenase